jgi:hypothetical protein
LELRPGVAPNVPRRLLGVGTLAHFGRYPVGSDGYAPRPPKGLAPAKHANYPFAALRLAQSLYPAAWLSACKCVRRLSERRRPWLTAFDPQRTLRSPLYATRTPC